MSLLNDLGLRYGTDKNNTRHGYLRHYERYLEPYRFTFTKILELGVDTGASLRMWEEYFPVADIHGVDNEPHCQDQAGGRRFVHTMVQDDPKLIPELAKRYGPFDLIIDDASHCGHAQLASFELLYPCVAPGGFYIVEDLQVGYMGWSHINFVTEAKRYVDKVVYAGKSGWGDPRNNEADGPQWLANMDDFERQTRGLHTHQGMMIFEKWGADEVY